LKEDVMNEPANYAAARKEIDATLADMFAAWNRGDVRGYAGFWSEDGELVNVLGMHRRGRAEILAELEFLHAGRFRGTQIRSLEYSVRFLGPEIAIVHLPWEMHGDKGQPGHEVPGGIRRGIFTHVICRGAEGWRLTASQNTDVAPIPDFLKMPVKSA
jgi:uncharacterized protein (TIGR02246 family)